MPIMGGGGGAAFNGGTITTGLTVDPPANTQGLTLNAAAGNASDVLELFADSADTTNTVFRVDQHGNLFINSGGTFQEAKIVLADNTPGNSGQIVIDTFSGVLLGPEASANPLLALNPYAAHTGRLLSALDSSAVEGLAIIPDAYLVIKRHAAPADAALAAGECALWFDQTNGTAALNIKAKQANGTVKTATIPVIT